MINIIKSLLKIKCLFIDKVYEDSAGINIKCRSMNPKPMCKYCTSTRSNIHSYREQSIKHDIIKGKIVWLHVKRRRFKCKNCLRTFTEIIPELIEKKQHSKNFYQQLAEQLARNSFNTTVINFKTSYTTCKNSLYVIKIDQAKRYIFHPNCKEMHLGIDGHSFSGHDMACTITDLRKKRLINILESDSKFHLTQYLQAIPGDCKAKITQVCIDMNARYKTVINEVLPHTKIVIDKFHVIQFLNRQIDEYRKLLQNLKKVKIPKYIFLKNYEDLKCNEKALLHYNLNRYPPLETLWKAKEDIKKMYNVHSRKIANYYLNKVIKNLISDAKQLIYKTGKSLQRWKKEILNYFISRITNAFTEGCHTKMKLIKRLSYGFKNKTVYINKMMLSFIPFMTILYFSTPP